MFDEHEIFLLKELVELEIAEIDDMFKVTNDTDKLTLKSHQDKLRIILEKLNNF